MILSDLFQSTHPVWDGTRRQIVATINERISIHPSRVGWDRGQYTEHHADAISIHPSRVGWDKKEAQS